MLGKTEIEDAYAVHQAIHNGLDVLIDYVLGVRRGPNAWPVAVKKTAS